MRRVVLVMTVALVPAPACSRHAPEPVSTSAAPPASILPFGDEPLERPAGGDRELATKELTAAQRLDRFGANDAALAQVGKALAADPTLVEARLLRAKLLLDDGPAYEPVAALRESRLALLLDPGDPAALATEGLARFVLDDSMRARALLERYLALPPEQWKPGLRAAAEEALGFLALRRGDVDEAERRLDAAHEQRPTRAFACYGVAMVAGERGDLAGKERWLGEALRLDPHLLVARHERAALLQRSGRAEEAAHERQVYEILRRLKDDTSLEFAQDHRGKADLWGDLARLLNGDSKSRTERLRELAFAHDDAAVAAEGSAALKDGLLAPEVAVETARAQARLGQADLARATVAALEKREPGPPKELIAALRAEVERLLAAAGARSEDRK